jgi:hypothetical protein
MHPRKEEALAQIAEATRELDAAIEQMKDIAAHPGREGWASSLKAAATLPFLGVGALITDLGEVGVRRISDKEFERDFPEG